MTDPQPLGAEAGTYALANGVRIFYRDVGQGQPLILLHGGTSTGGGWIGQGSLATFAPHFRLIAPDTRGHGRTRNPAGAPTYAQLARRPMRSWPTIWPRCSRRLGWSAH